MTRIPLLALGALLAPGWGASAQEPASADGRIVAPLEAVSVFASGEYGQYFHAGIFYGLSPAPTKGVKCPEFASEHPYHGSLRIGAKKDYRFAFDESQGTGKGYDRLYLDLDCDGDLSNEKPLRPHPAPPEGALADRGFMKKQVCFEAFSLVCDYGTSGKHPVEILPRMGFADGGDEPMPLATFTETKVRKGEIEIAGKVYEVLLGHPSSLGKPFDDSNTNLVLVPRDDEPRVGSLESKPLRTMAWLGERLYRFTASPFGEQLIAEPYAGEFGILEFAAGERKLDAITVSGDLDSEKCRISLRDMVEKGESRVPCRCRIPVGDYAPEYLSLVYGDTMISLSQNYRFGESGEQPALGTSRKIAIRAGETFRIDFSSRPEVRIVRPGEKQRVTRGEEVRVEAALVDLELGVMFREFQDRSRKTAHEFKSPDGEVHSYETFVTLQPTVRILRSDGQTLAEGVMPFG